MTNETIPNIPEPVAHIVGQSADVGGVLDDQSATESEDGLRQWIKALTHLVALGGAMSKAVAARDVVAAIAVSHHARSARARLISITPKPPTTSAEISAMADAKMLMPSVRVAEVIFDRWRTRQLPSDDVLASTPLGAAILADALLPSAWDFGADVAVLVGDGFERVAEILLAVGQRRLIVVGNNAPAGALSLVDAEEAGRAVRTMDPDPPKRFSVRGIGAARAHLAAYGDSVGLALSDLRVHRNTVQEFSHTWIAQGAANLSAIARWPSIGKVGDRFAGVPMIICAPGPSLAKNVDLLRAAKGRALIVAVSHSLKPLIAAGVEPDLVFTVDPQDVQYHFAGIDVSRMTLINGATVHPALYKLGAARYLTLAANSALDAWAYEGLDESPIAAGGGSVATSAFTVALKWKCDPIITVGLDLSFSGGQYYVSTSTDGDAHIVTGANGTVKIAGWSEQCLEMKKGGGPALSSERAVELPALGGGTVPSSFMLSMFHRWFVETAKEVRAHHHLYNCTEGGAFIEGMEHRTLSSVLAELTKTYDIPAILDDVVNSIDSRARMETARQRAINVRKQLKLCVALAERCRRLTQTAATDAGAEHRLRDAEAALSESIREILFVSMVAQREIGLALIAARQVSDMSEALAASRALFDAVIAAAKEVDPHLEVAANAEPLA